MRYRNQKNVQHATQECFNRSHVMYNLNGENDEGDEDDEKRTVITNKIYYKL